MRRGFGPAICIGLCIATFAPTLRAQDAPPAAGYPPAYPPPEAPPPQYPPPSNAQPYGQAPPPYNAYPAPPPAPPPVVGPWKMPYEDGQPIPPGYRVEERVRTGSVVSGAILIGVPYLIGLTVASADNYEDQTRYLLVPVAGPWLMLAMHKRPASCQTDTTGECITDSLLRFYLTTDGIVQGVGAVLLVWGMHGRKILVRDAFASSLYVAPAQLTASTNGLVLGGRF
jgi:hypothetical protein